MFGALCRCHSTNLSQPRRVAVHGKNGFGGGFGVYRKLRDFSKHHQCRDLRKSAPAPLPDNPAENAPHRPPEQAAFLQFPGSERPRLAGKPQIKGRMSGGVAPIFGDHRTQPLFMADSRLRRSEPSVSPDQPPRHPSQTTSERATNEGDWTASNRALGTSRQHGEVTCQMSILIRRLPKVPQQSSTPTPAGTSHIWARSSAVEQPQGVVPGVTEDGQLIGPRKHRRLRRWVAGRT